MGHDEERLTSNGVQGLPIAVAVRPNTRQTVG